MKRLALQESKLAVRAAKARAGEPSNQDAVAQLECQERELLKRGVTALRREAAKICLARSEGWGAQLEETIQFALGMVHAADAVRQARRALERCPDTPTTPALLRFQVSTLFLAECGKYLTSDPSLSERMHLTTGPVTPEGVRVLSRMEHIAYEKQTRSYVKLKRPDCHAKLCELDLVHGHEPLAFFHSHIVRGAAGTAPSAEDRSHQARYEKTGYEVIGGIFSLDGFVRFFSNDLPFAMDIYGAGVEKLSDEPCMKVFRLPAALRGRDVR